jgi:hypothetical protein
MRKRKIQNYYCLVKTEKFGGYQLMIRQGTNGQAIRKELINEGIRVFRCMTSKEVRKAKSYKNYGEFILDGRRETNFPNGAFEFIQSIQLLPEDVTNKIIRYYDRSFKMWCAYIEDDNKNRLTAIEFRQTKDEINALTKIDFRERQY